MRDEQSDAVFALRAGARGFVTASESGNIVEALESLRSGQVYFSHQIIARAFASDGTTPDQLLSRRELEVFNLLANGLTSRQMAKRLGLSVKSTDAYLTRAKDKLRLKNLIELRRASFCWNDSPGNKVSGRIRGRRRSPDTRVS